MHGEFDFCAVLEGRGHWSPWEQTHEAVQERQDWRRALVWRAPGWSLWRRLHRTAFALVHAGLAVMMVNWGLAFAGPL